MECLILEDHVMLADLLARNITELPGVKVSGLAHSVAQGKRLCRRLRPDLLIVDLLLPDGEGVEVAEALLQERRDARVIILSAATHRLVCSRHLHDAIVAVIDKTEAIDVLHQLIRGLLGRPGDAGSSGSEPLASLTGRERQILGLIGRGFSSEVIADKLGISLLTARTHRRNITTKLGLRGAELVLYASSCFSPPG